MRYFKWLKEKVGFFGPLCVLLIVAIPVLRIMTDKPYIEVGREKTRIHKGLTIWCMRRNCTNSGAHRISADKWLEDIRIWNDGVNKMVTYRSDMKNYGVKDSWFDALKTPDMRGDCEDYALAKRQVLIDNGVPSAALSIAHVYVKPRKKESTGSHAVLVVRTNEGDYVLDNRTVDVVRWDKLDADFVSLSEPDTLLRWKVVTNDPKRIRKTRNLLGHESAELDRESRNSAFGSYWGMSSHFVRVRTNR